MDTNAHLLPDRDATMGRGRIEAKIDELIAVTSVIGQTQALHGKMLEMLLEALAAPDEVNGQLVSVLREVIAALEAQRLYAARSGEQIALLPGVIGSTIAGELRKIVTEDLRDAHL